ncbi:MAG TPA: hypothetical protein VLC28_14640 [Flavitalea sp.]|nr:hypothetical protein [Flavitalea sp.]
MKNQQKEVSLAFCILMDFIGYASYAVPFLGEFADILWAPVSAFIFYRTFGGWKGAFGGVFNFVEELLPGLDFIPTFTITWVVNYFGNRKAETGIQKTETGVRKPVVAKQPFRILG